MQGFLTAKADAFPFSMPLQEEGSFLLRRDLTKKLYRGAGR
jgi:hypothetical protein